MQAVLSRHVVYLNNNNFPSLLYINSAHGTTKVTDSNNGSSDIVQLILYPSSEVTTFFEKF